MAKRKAKDGDVGAAVPAQLPEPEPTPAPPEFKPVRRTVTVEVPLQTLPPNVYISRHVDVTLNHKQAQALKSLTNALDDDGAVLSTGRRVVTGNGAVGWLLDRLAEGSEETGSDE